MDTYALILNLHQLVPRWRKHSLTHYTLGMRSNTYSSLGGTHAVLLHLHLLDGTLMNGVLLR